ncbi:hypothetical protein NUU61_001665 [Penicillium alfredii]|uniref:Uncharacterized protein n=1 Tax=Penicillium alfredii TaxID=1506179 RepID=A0A9W9FQ42_9EURO|nr:uncharacterized protein NUU61_001665 [Penicillium alfredii]KAJ5104318.1 hypothetical protein NUU61_001665 [Penicillium alfredii]
MSEGSRTRTRKGERGQGGADTMIGRHQNTDESDPRGEQEALKSFALRLAATMRSIRVETFPDWCRADLVSGS